MTIHSSQCAGVPGNVPGVDRMREDVCDCVYGELARAVERIANLERIVRLLANATCDVERANIAVMARNATEK